MNASRAALKLAVPRALSRMAQNIAPPLPPSADRATDYDQQARSQEQPTPPAPRGQRVFYIDDDELLVSLVQRKLSRLGYAVTCEVDPHAALALFLKDPEQFDVVVTDLSMPGLGGFDLAEKMLAVRENLPVFVASGFVRPEDQATALSIGVRKLILKPNTCDGFGAVLDKLFQDER